MDATPPVRVLDFGYQAPNPIDYMRAGQQAMVPIQEAMAKGYETRNQFLLNQINNQKEFELARQQHDMQLERERMRDERMMKVQQMRSDAMLAAGEQKAKMLAVANAAERLARLGGDPTVDPTDPKALETLSERTKERRDYMVHADAQLIAGNQIQRQQIQDAKDKLTGKIDSAGENQINSAAAGLSFDRFLKSGSPLAQQVLATAQEKGIPITQAAAATPGAREEINQYFGESQLAAEYKYRSEKNPQYAAQLSDLAKKQAALDAEMKLHAYIGGPNGRTIPKETWDESTILANDVLNGKHTEADGTATVDKWFPGWKKADAAAATPPIAPPTVVLAPEVNPTVAPAAAGFSESGASINQAPLAVLGRDLRDASYGVPMNGWTDQDRFMASQIPGFLNGAINGPAASVRGIGGLFDSSIQSPDNSPNSLRFSPIAIPPEIAARIAASRQSVPVQAPPQAVVAPVVPTPVAPQQQFYVPPTYSGATNAPSAAMFDPSLIVNRAPDVDAMQRQNNQDDSSYWMNPYMRMSQ